MHTLLENVGHEVENIDFIYFERAFSNEVRPQKGESKELYWFTKEEIESNDTIKLDLCQYSRHIFLVFLSRFCNKIFIILWSHITNSAMNSFSVIPTFNILKY